MFDRNKHSVYYLIHNLFSGGDMSINTDKEIIRTLGGSTKVAELLGFKNKQRVQNWMSRGIPASIKLEYPHLFLNPKIQASREAS